MWKRSILSLIIYLMLFLTISDSFATEKPILYGRHWIAITGKPLAATAGAKIFERGGNAVDAACAMLAATSTMWDVLSWGGETQALIYNSVTKKIIGINALGVAPSGATADSFRKKGMKYPPEYGPLAAVTPGTPGGLMVMLAEYGTMSLKEVLQPAMEMAKGYPIEAQTANSIERHKKRIRQWRYSKKIFLTHPGEEREAPYPGEIFRQSDLLRTLKKLVAAEHDALASGVNRKQAIYAAYDRFYKGDIAEEFVRGCQEQGGLITMGDMANWEVYQEEPVQTNYKGIDVYKLTCWVQGPVLLQTLNILENFDLRGMGYNSANYIHTLYQAMNLAYADRDFYYGDPYFPPEEPLKGLLSKKYAQQRAKLISPDKNNPNVKPGDPYATLGQKNPYKKFLEEWAALQRNEKSFTPEKLEEEFFRGTTSIQAADENGWIVSVTPSGGWIPACIAGNTGIGMSQRMQSFVLDEKENPFNVVEPGKRPRATLTPTIAIKNGKPFLSFSIQGGDTQDQNCLQFFLDIVEFGMTVQEACEAANIVSYQMHSSFGKHDKAPGRLTLRRDVPQWVQSELKKRGYQIRLQNKTSGPMNAIFFDWKHGSFWGGSSNYGDDYGIAW